MKCRAFTRGNARPGHQLTSSQDSLSQLCLTESYVERYQAPLERGRGIWFVREVCKIELLFVDE